MKPSRTGLVFYSEVHSWQEWKSRLQNSLPDLALRHWDEKGKEDEVEYAIVWDPPCSVLQRRFPNLKVIFVLGAGVDHLMEGLSFPNHIQIVRLVTRNMIILMAEYVTLHVLRIHRCQKKLEQQQRERRWKQIVTPSAPNRTIGIMGCGVFGSEAAAVLKYLNFHVVTWSSKNKSLNNNLQKIEFIGADELDRFLENIMILVVMLPLTNETRKILNMKLFKKLPMGASLINVGRGGLHDEGDIIEALDSGQLKEVVLDVFSVEPLPASSPLWAHRNVTVTPHNAALNDFDTDAAAVIDNIKRVMSGGSPEYIVDNSRAY